MAGEQIIINIRQENNNIRLERTPEQTSLFLWWAHAQCCLTKPTNRKTMQQAQAGVVSIITMIH